MRPAFVIVLLAALATGACKGKSKSKEQPAATTPPAPTPTLDAAPVDPGHTEVDTGVTAAGVTKILPPKLGLPLPFAAVAIDGTAPLPPALRSGFGGDRWWRSPEYPGAAVMHMKDEEDRVVELGVILPATGGRELLTRLWGEPTVGRAFRGEGEQVERVAWFDPAAGLRAWIADDIDDVPRLSFTHYRPSAEQLRRLHDAAPLFGKPIAEAAPLLGTGFNEDLSLALNPPGEWDAFGTGDASGFSLKGDGGIEVIYTRVFYGSPAHRAEVLALIKDLWGAPDGSVYGTGPYLRVHETPESMSLDLSLTTTDPRKDDELP